MASDSAPIDPPGQAEANLAQAYERLRISEQRLQFLADNARDVIWTMTLDGRISSISAAVEKVRGYTPAEAMRQTLDEILTPASQALTIDFFTRLHAALQAGRVPENFRGEQEYLCKDGSTVWTEVMAYPVLDEHGVLREVAGVTRDIDERKRHENELRRARDEALAASQAKSEFLANMSHEIRTPLTAMIGLSSVLLETRLDDRQRDCVRKIERAGTVLLRVLDSVLDQSRLEAGRMQIENAPFRLDALVERCRDLFSIDAAERHLTLDFRIAPQVPAWLGGDALRLQQVLDNLVGNALKFTEHGGVAVDVSVQAPRSDDESPAPGRHRTDAGGEVPPLSQTVLLRIEVRDTGIGMTPGQIARLFSAFQQGDASTTRKYGGSGLGLSIAKRLVELMGGHIGVDSVPGQGSLFWFSLPLRRAAPDLAPPELHGGATRKPAPLADPVAREADGAAVVPLLQELTRLLQARLARARQLSAQIEARLAGTTAQAGYARVARAVARYDFDAALGEIQALAREQQWTLA